MQSRRPSRFGGFAICVPRPAVRRRKFRSKVRNRFLILSLPPPIRETGVQLPKLRRCPSATKPNLTLRIALGVGSPYPARAFSRPNWPRRLPNRAGALLLFRAVRNFDFQGFILESACRPTLGRTQRKAPWSNRCWEFRFDKICRCRVGDETARLEDVGKAAGSMPLAALL